MRFLIGGLVALAMAVAIALPLMRRAPAGGAPGLVVVNGAHHDFGPRPVQDVLQKLTHEFLIRNNLDRTVRVDRIRSSCGCTAATMDRSEIGPGETSTVSATLTVDGPGRTAVNVWVDLGEDGVITLLLEATGERRQEAVLLTPGPLHLDDSNEARIEFIVTRRDSDASPDPPVIEVPDGFTFRFVGYDKLHDGVRSTRQAPRWLGSAIIRPAPDGVASGSLADAGADRRVLVRVGSDARWTIPIKPADGGV